MGGGTVGGGTVGGGTNGGGTVGGGTPHIVNALGDSYATPLFCSSLTSAREACTDPADKTIWGLTFPKDQKNQSRIGRWDPWVRSYLCAQTLISDITIQSGEIKDGPFEPPILLPHNVTLHAENMQSTLFANLNFAATPEDTTLWKKVPICTIVRPEERVFKKQVVQVIDWADLRQERMAEILTQIENTYAFWGAQIPIQSDRLRNTRELLDAVVQFAMFVEMRMKNDLAAWRPTDYSPEVQPMITTPGHGSMPCGHCTEGYAIKEVLQSLLRMNPSIPRHAGLRTQFSRIVARMSMNRVIAGVHFPVDNLAGRLLGKAIGRYFAYRCNGTPQGRIPDREGAGGPVVQPALMYGVFRGDLCQGDEMFEPEQQEIFPHAGKAPSRPPFYEVHDIGGFDQSSSFGADPILKEMWARAHREVRLLQLDFD